MRTFYTVLKINQAVKGINLELQKSLLNLLLVLKSECLDQIYVLRLDLFTNCDQTIIFLIGLIRAQKRRICYPGQNQMRCKNVFNFLWLDYFMSRLAPISHWKSTRTMSLSPWLEQITDKNHHEATDRCLLLSVLSQLRWHECNVKYFLTDFLGFFT